MNMPSVPEPGATSPQPLPKPAQRERRWRYILLFVGLAAFRSAPLCRAPAIKTRRTKRNAASPPSIGSFWGPMLFGGIAFIAGAVRLAQTGSSEQASWRPDPTGRHQQRYWNGSTWTDRVMDGPDEARDRVPGVQSTAPDLQRDKHDAPSTSVVSDSELATLRQKHGDVFDQAYAEFTKLPTKPRSSQAWLGELCRRIEAGSPPSAAAQRIPLDIGDPHPYNTDAARPRE
jgi:hypothetical protein